MSQRPSSPSKSDVVPTWSTLQKPTTRSALRLLSWAGKTGRKAFTFSSKFCPGPNQPCSVKLRARERPIPASVVRKRRKGVSYFAQTLRPIRRSLTSSRDAVSKRSGSINSLNTHPAPRPRSGTGRAKGNTASTLNTRRRISEASAARRSRGCGRNHVCWLLLRRLVRRPVDRGSLIEGGAL